MTYQDRQEAFDQHAHACYLEAASALSPAMQGRLRAARRTALATAAPGRRHVRRWSWPWPVLPVGAVAAALLAVAVGLRWQPGGESGPIPAGMSAAQSTSADQARQEPDLRSTRSDPPEPALADSGRPEPAPAASQTPDAALAGVRSKDDDALLMLDEDPDFYLWLGGDDALPANAEPGHDPT
jgi:hypothetical protein